MEGEPATAEAFSNAAKESSPLWPLKILQGKGEGEGQEQGPRHGLNSAPGGCDELNFPKPSNRWLRVRRESLKQELRACEDSAPPRGAGR